MRARKWIGFTYKRASEDTTLTIVLGLLKKSRGTYVNGAIIAMLYTHLIRIINNNNNRPPACNSTSLWDRKQGIKE